jgi:hypothetical protein
MKRNYLLLIALAILALLPIFYVLINGFSLLPTNNSAGYTPEEHIDEPEKGFEASAMIEKLPHQGSNFSMAYDFETALFYVYINPQNPTAGEAELDQFLNANGIDDKSQVPGLETSSVPLPTTAP